MKRDELYALLKEEIAGEVSKDRAKRIAYSCDASIFEEEPLLVVIPKNKGDVIKTVEIAWENSISVTPRGAATGTTGGCLGKGIILDLSKYLTSIHFHGISVSCEPGVVQEDLNKHLSFYDLRLGPDTSSGNRATIGGMFANNAAGSRSPKFGVMADHVISCEMVLSDATIVTFGALNEEELQEKCQLKTLEGAIYRKAIEIRDSQKEEIEKHFPKFERRVSGYSLDRLYEKPFNLAKVIAGSEGSFGIVTELELNVVKKLPKTYLSIYFFDHMREAFAFIPELLKKPFISIEMIDEEIIRAAKESFVAKHHLHWIREGARCILFVESEEKSEHDEPDQESVFLVRKKGLELLLSQRGYTRAYGFLEDISYPREKSLEFYDKFITLFDDIPQKGIYGHVGAGCLHFRPFFDIRNREVVKEILRLMEKATDVLIELGGSLSGEHGDGLVRSWLNQRLYGEKIYKAFVGLKKAFDPKGIMNPAKVVGRKFSIESLRTFPKKEIETFLDFSKEGGLALSADLCNGNGLCRKKEGLMCPSYQATLDEFDTTRARAEVLRNVINSGKGDLSDKDLKKVLDLCIECKGCKTECPSSVDMAKMKAEVLYHQPKSLRDLLFAHLPSIWKMSSNFPNFVNQIQQWKWIKSFIGINSKTLPTLSPKRFSEEVKKNSSGKPVVLFNDTYTEFSVNSIGQSAVQLLQNLGFAPEVPPWSCCGRPAFSKGFLKQARSHIRGLVDQLYPFAKKGLDILVLEPSCYSMLKEDLFALLGYEDEKAQIVAKKVRLIDEFLLEYMPKISAPNEKILIHTHCHQKASDNKLTTYHLLKKLGDWQVKEIPSGCCGMAGSFGYEKEHTSISKKILNIILLPTLEQSQFTTLIANGFSCRSQLYGHRPEHVIEFLARQKLFQ